MRVTVIDTNNQRADVEIGILAHQRLMIGITRINGIEGSVIVVRDIEGVAGDGWKVYVNRSEAAVNLIKAKMDPLADPASGRDVPGSDDPVDFQVAFAYAGHFYQIGNRTNAVDDDPIERVGPERVASVTFDLKHGLADVTLA